MSLITGNPLGGIVSGVGGDIADLGLDAVGSWVLHGTEAALDHVAQIIGQATAPQLESSWFSGAYWQVAGIATLLTLPFLFAAAIQAVLRSDLTLLARAAFMHLPVAILGVALAAPLVTLLLSATDEMCSIVSGVGNAGGATLLDQAAAAAATTSALDGSPFFAFVVGLIALAAALALTLELTIRASAVYVVVLMLPLAFAALVWPARRVWAVRTVELLISLILSKFVIVAVLSLAGAAFAQDSTDTLLTAMTLLLLATFAPWALMRMLPFTEVAAAAAGNLRSELPGTLAPIATAGALAEGGMDLLSSISQRPQPDADQGWSDDVGSGAWESATMDGESEDEATENDRSESGGSTTEGGDGQAAESSARGSAGETAGPAGGTDGDEVAAGRGGDGDAAPVGADERPAGATESADAAEATGTVDAGGGRMGAESSVTSGGGTAAESGAVGGAEAAAESGTGAAGGADMAGDHSAAPGAAMSPADGTPAPGALDTNGGGPMPTAPGADIDGTAIGAEGAMPEPDSGQTVGAPDGSQRERSPGSDGSQRERLPGFDPIWQAENGEWPEMTLGPDGWAGPTAYDPEAPAATEPSIVPPPDESDDREEES